MLRKSVSKKCARKNFLTESHNMTKISILIALLLHLFCTMVRGTIPCSEYFTYMIDPETHKVLGRIEIPSPQKNYEFYLKISLNIAAELSREIFRLELAQSIKESIQAVQQGRPLLYHVYFPFDENFPILSAIWFNNQQYCLSSEVSSGNKATIELEDIVHLPNERPLSQHFQHRNSSSYRVNNSTYDRLNYFSHSKPTIATSSEEISNNILLNRMLSHSIQKRNTNSNNNNNDECGITNYYTDITNSLIANGETTLPGQWPWVVAFYLLIPDECVNEFKCTGSILTTKHIITAARCLKLNFLGNETIDPDNLYVAFGNFNSRPWYETINREVANYKIHPDAHSRTGDSDLAIVILRTPVEYSPFIKPICLWSGSTNLEDVIDRVGYVVGWGKDEFGEQNTEEPRMVRVPIVSEEDCLTSDPGFIHITSNRTFCAGLQDVNGPCYADKGSGLVFFNATTGRYQLRGIVSRSILRFRLCYLGKYIVYTDVAKYIPWIQQQISST